MAPCSSLVNPRARATVHPFFTWAFCRLTCPWPRERTDADGWRRRIFEREGLFQRSVFRSLLEGILNLLTAVDG